MLVTLLVTLQIHRFEGIQQFATRRDWVIEDASFLRTWFRNISHFRRSKLTGHGCKLPNDRLSRDRRRDAGRRGSVWSVHPRIGSGMKTRK